MDDNDLLAAVREDFTKVRMTTGAEEILADGGSLRRRRYRRRVYGAAAALAAVAAISVASLVPGSPGTSGTSNVQLTAWTVQKQQDGTVTLVIREVRNLTALQRKLDADGVPAVVYNHTDDPRRTPPGCVVNLMPTNQRVVVVTPGRSVPGSFVLHPSAIPAGSKVLLGFDGLKGLGGAWLFRDARISIVYASANCR
jgi:hypothetical protein